MELFRYLDNAFFTEPELLAASGIGAAQLADLQARRVMPRASYRLRVDIACDSYFGAHKEQAHADYYAKGYACWIGMLQTLAQDTDAFRVFERRYRARLEQLAQGGIASRHPKLNAGLDAHLREEWRHFLDGTYGLCTRSGLPEDIAVKEAAVAIIKEITQGRREQALTDAERARLTTATDLLDAASARFAPHELERSSRRRLIDQVRAAFLRPAGAA
jgi:uncharacterized protein YeaO (DUF488 family)